MGYSIKSTYRFNEQNSVFFFSLNKNLRILFFFQTDDMHFLILLVVQAAMPGAIAEEERKSSALEMLQASDIRLPVEVDLGSTYEEINALSEKFKELESKFEASETSETKINELKSKIAQMEEASSSTSESNNDISGLKSDIARVERASASKISGLQSKIAQVERDLPKCQWGKTVTGIDSIRGFQSFAATLIKTFKFERPFTKIPSVMISVVGSWSVSSGSEDFYVWIHKVTPTEVTVKAQGSDKD